MRKVLVITVFLWSLSFSLVMGFRSLGHTGPFQDDVVRYLTSHGCHYASLRTGRSVRVIMPKEVFLSPSDGRYMAKRAPDQSLALTYDAKGYQVVDRQGQVIYRSTIPDGYRIGSLEWMGDSRHVVHALIPLENAVTDALPTQIAVVDGQSGSVAKLGRYHEIYLALPAPQGDWVLLYSYSAYANGDHYIRALLINWRTRHIYIPRYEFRTFAWSPDGRWLAVIIREAEPRQHDQFLVLNVETGERWMFQPETAFDFGWSPDSRYLSLLVLEGSGYPFAAWLIDTRAPESVIRTDLVRWRSINQVHWSPDSQHVALVQMNTVNYQVSVTLLSTGRWVPQLLMESNPSRFQPQITWARDSRRLLSREIIQAPSQTLHGRAEVKVWDLQGQLLRTLVLDHNPYAVTLSDPGAIDFQAACAY